MIFYVKYLLIFQAVRRFSACNDFEHIASCFDMLEEMERALSAAAGLQPGFTPESKFCALILLMMATLKNRTVRSDYTGNLSAVFAKKLYLRTSEHLHPGWSAAEKAVHAASLTPQQKRAAKLMCEGYSYRTIKKEMGIQFSTVRSHIELIYRKLDVTSMDEAIRKIRQFHLLDEPG